MCNLCRVIMFDVLVILGTWYLFDIYVYVITILIETLKATVD